MIDANAAIAHIDFLEFRELDANDTRIAPLFQRKFGCAPPDAPHHLGALFRAGDGSEQLGCYVHFFELDPVILVGGACVDGAVIRRMSSGQRKALSAVGGLYYWTLVKAFAAYSSRCEAFFGYCGDARAYEVDIAAGFEDTGIQYLIARFDSALPQSRREALIGKIAAIGPF